jgi:hypothetical protein
MAGVWALTFMAILGVVLFAIFPLILRRRKKKEGAALHERIEKAKADILEDGIVEGPKGPRVPHKPWGVGMTGGTRRSGPPEGKSYHGGSWPQ